MKILILIGQKNLLETGAMPERFVRIGRCLSRVGFEPSYLSVGSANQFAQEFASQPKPDLVFSTVCSTNDPPESRKLVHAMLEKAGQPFVGSDSEAIGLVLSKPVLKSLWQKHDIPTPGFFTFSGFKEFESFLKLVKESDFPFIIKPAKEGNSRGIDENSVVFDRQSLIARSREMLPVFGELMVESFLGETSGLREFTVALVGNGPAAYYLPAELILQRKHQVRVITTADKEMHHAMAVPIADPVMKNRVAAFATAALKAAGVRDYARCDILLANDQLYAIEINGQPMIPDPWFEVCAAGEGLGNDQYVNAIVMAAITRQQQEGQRELRVPSDIDQGQRIG